GLRGYRITPEGIRGKATGEGLLRPRECRRGPGTALGFLLDVRFDPLYLFAERTVHRNGPGLEFPLAGLQATEPYHNRACVEGEAQGERRAGAPGSTNIEICRQRFFAEAQEQDSDRDLSFVNR